MYTGVKIGIWVSWQGQVAQDPDALHRELTAEDEALMRYALAKFLPGDDLICFVLDLFLYVLNVNLSPRVAGACLYLLLLCR